jgi:hypothetical protein
MRLARLSEYIPEKASGAIGFPAPSVILAFAADL